MRQHSDKGAAAINVGEREAIRQIVMTEKQTKAAKAARFYGQKYTPVASAGGECISTQP